jgi:hypothetical protein
MSKTSSKLSNANARHYFLHDADTHHDTGSRTCFFANGLKEKGWGFWVREDGTVDVDDESSNGTLPSKKIVNDCVRAAVKYLTN